VKLQLIISFLFFCLVSNVTSQKFEYELNTNWKFSQEGKGEWKKATVPGVIHLDLFNNNMIEDPYWENNDLKQRWIEEEDWAYVNQLFYDPTIYNTDNIELVFEGLDTYATVLLNGDTLLIANNMFRSWTVNVKKKLIIGLNEIKILFTSPILHNKEVVENYAYKLPSGNETSDIKTKVSSFTRKAAYHFGWDWGPRFVTSGIWRPVKLKGWNNAKVSSFQTSTLSIDSSKADMQTNLEIEVDKSGEYVIFFDSIKQIYKLEKGVNNVVYNFSLKNPKLWWCNGMGEAFLYKHEIDIFYNKEHTSSIGYKYGIRTIELINEKDSIGTSFYFKLNGKPVFMKGANYIPQDMFIPRVKSEQTNRLITQVKNANMNMLRVWGGGIYEENLFYSLCDKNGILVWQDFMFAGSLYPSEPAFKQNIKQEVIQNIKRLRFHPCIALWCGNNEIEVAWNNWGWQKQFGYSSEDSIEIWNNYKSIFEEMIPELVKEYTSTSYTSTSPQSNWGTKENFNHSSMHYWGVWHGKEPFTNFTSNVGRFMVEYGFQSFPELSTLKKVMSDSSLSLTSSAMKNRQKSYIGNGLILEHIKRNFKEPNNFEEFIILSQETQAKAMQIAIQAHIKKQPHCMGSLFWQLNDCWPGPSWSVIDYYGEEKQAYNVVKMEYSTHP
jgi:beta-mannosidase